MQNLIKEPYLQSPTADFQLLGKIDMGSSVSTGPTSDSSSTFSSAENSTEENEMNSEHRAKLFGELQQRMRRSSPRPPVAPPRPAPPPPPRRSISSVPSTPSSASAHTPCTRSQSLDAKSQSTAQNQSDGKF